MGNIVAGYDSGVVPRTMKHQIEYAGHKWEYWKADGWMEIQVLPVENPPEVETCVTIKAIHKAILTDNPFRKFDPDSVSVNCFGKASYQLS